MTRMTLNNQIAHPHWISISWEFDATQVTTNKKSNRRNHGDDKDDADQPNYSPILNFNILGT